MTWSTSPALPYTYFPRPSKRPVYPARLPHHQTTPRRKTEQQQKKHAVIIEECNLSSFIWPPLIHNSIQMRNTIPLPSTIHTVVNTNKKSHHFLKVIRSVGCSSTILLVSKSKSSSYTVILIVSIKCMHICFPCHRKLNCGGLANARCISTSTWKLHKTLTHSHSHNVRALRAVTLGKKPCQQSLLYYNIYVYLIHMS